MSFNTPSSYLLSKAPYLCFLLTIPYAAAEQNSDGNSAQEAVDVALAQLRTWDDARGKLSGLKNEAVVEAIIVALGRSPGLKEEVRTFAYIQLVERGAIEMQSGFDQLTACLDDPPVADICAAALVKAPRNRLAAAAEPIRAYLQSASVRQGTERAGPGITGVLKAIGRRGHDGMMFIPLLEQIVRDANRDDEIRRWSAWAVLQIKPLDEAFEFLLGLDPSGVELTITMWPQQIAILVAQSLENGNSLDQRERQAIQIARELVLTTLQSPRAETRKAAFQAMAAAYGTDMVIIRSSNDYELRPALRTVFETMAESDPDPELRQAAARYLDPQWLDSKVARILRWRERQSNREP